MSKKKNPMETFLGYVEQLRFFDIPHSIEYSHNEAMMVVVATPSEYWEINFYIDGRVELERFESKEFLEGEEVLEKTLNYWISGEEKTKTDSETQD